MFMTPDFTTSNLSKIRPKLRTQGNVTGNFGKMKVRANSPIRELGITDVKVVRCATQDEYLNRLYLAYDNTDNSKLKKFIFQEIRKIHIQRGTW
jgi:hypothetical protein